MEKVIRRFASFEKADKADVDYYRRLTPTERLDILLELVKQGQNPNEAECGLEKVYRIVELAQS